MALFRRIFQQQFSINGTYSVIADVNDEFFATETVVIPEFGMITVILVTSIMSVLIISRLKISHQIS